MDRTMQNDTFSQPVSAHNPEDDNPGNRTGKASALTHAITKAIASRRRHSPFHHARVHAKRALPAAATINHIANSFHASLNATRTPTSVSVPPDASSTDNLTLPPAAPSEGIVYMRDAAQQLNITLRTLDRWIKAAGLTPHQDLTDLRRRYLTAAEFEELAARHPVLPVLTVSQTSTTTTTAPVIPRLDADQVSPENLAQLEDITTSMGEQMARITTVNQQLAELESTITAMRSHLGRTVKDLSRIVTDTITRDDTTGLNQSKEDRKDSD
jgi:uncharacterized coiled-coil protein SlyX